MVGMTFAMCVWQRALELITGMVTRRNLPDIVKRLVDLVETTEGVCRDAFVEKIIFMCSRDNFEYLEDFAWYISVLIKLASVQVSSSGNECSEYLASQPKAWRLRANPTRQSLRERQGCPLSPSCPSFDATHLSCCTCTVCARAPHMLA